MKLSHLALKLMITLGCSHGAMAQNDGRTLNQNTIELINPADQNMVVLDHWTSAEMRRFDQMRRSQGRPPEDLIRKLFQMVPDGRLTQSALDAAVLVQQANVRAAAFAKIMPFDLNGDLAIDASEVSKNRDVRADRDLRQFELLMVDADTNRDGAVTTDELISYANLNTQDVTPASIDSFGILDMDTNGDGAVDATDIADFVAQMRANPLEEPVRYIGGFGARFTAGCELPEPSPDAEIIVLSAMTGAAVSSLAISGLDKLTSVMSINVAEGDRPIYLVALLKSPTIVVFEGAQERIQQVVAGHDGDGVGFVGVAPATVENIALAECRFTQFPLPRTPSARSSVAQIQLQLGRGVSRVIGHERVGRLMIPSGEHDPNMDAAYADQAATTEAVVRFALTADGIAPQPAQAVPDDAKATALRLMTSYPAGIVDVPEEMVVGSDELEPYAVLPSYAGLLQLIDAGRLEVIDGAHKFRIIGDIPTFPAELDYRTGVSFFLADGLTAPEGGFPQISVYGEISDDCLSRNFACGR